MTFVTIGRRFNKGAAFLFAWWWHQHTEFEFFHFSRGRWTWLQSLETLGTGDVVTGADQIRNDIQYEFEYQPKGYAGLPYMISK